MKCPYCGKGDCIPDVVFRWVEAYGHTGITGSNPRCTHCHKTLHVLTEMTIKVISIEKTDEEPDW